MSLSREDILGADDLARELVACPEWGDSVWVQELNGLQRGEFGSAFMTRDDEPPDMSRVHAVLGALSMVDDDGNPLFSATDVEALGKKSGTALERITKVAMRLSGLSDEDMEVTSEDFGERPNADSASG